MNRRSEIESIWDLPFSSPDQDGLVEVFNHATPARGVKRTQSGLSTPPSSQKRVKQAHSKTANQQSIGYSNQTQLVLPIRKSPSYTSFLSAARPNKIQPPQKHTPQQDSFTNPCLSPTSPASKSTTLPFLPQFDFSFHPQAPSTQAIPPISQDFSNAFTTTTDFPPSDEYLNPFSSPLKVIGKAKHKKQNKVNFEIYQDQDSVANTSYTALTSKQASERYDDNKENINPNNSDGDFDFSDGEIQQLSSLATQALPVSETIHPSSHADPNHSSEHIDEFQFDDAMSLDIELSSLAETYDHGNNVAAVANPEIILNSTQQQSSKLQWNESKQWEGNKAKKSTQVAPSSGETSSASIATLGKPSQHKPFVRPPFPASVSERPILRGVSQTTLLRTCFRLGEAIRASSQAAQQNGSVIIELYAKIASHDYDSSSHRRTITFQLCDIYTPKQPRPIAAKWSCWKGSKVKEEDLALLLAKSHAMCRVLGKMKSLAQGVWEMDVQSIWRATWSDLENVRGIVSYVGGQS